MSERKTLFADIILPIPVKNEFTYRIPFEMNELIQEGMRVVVPFGKSKLYTGIVTNIHENIPAKYQAKYIEYLLDESPIVTAIQYKFWKWIASYYMAPIGDILQAALPSNFKLASETKITLHPEYDAKTAQLNERQAQIIDALEIQEDLDLKAISEIVGIKTIQPIIKEMIDKRWVISLEEVSHKYIPKTAIYYFLTEKYQNEEALNEALHLFEDKSSKQKQQEALLLFLQEIDSNLSYQSPVSKKRLEEKGATVSSLKSLEKNGFLVAERLQIDRIEQKDKEIQAQKELNEAQQQSLLEIKASFEEKDICLLHGVTGSGKTEIYVSLIEEQMKAGNQVLFLLPEIALTTQLIERLSSYFGDKVGVYHSKFNANERVEIWNHVLHNHPERFRIIVGARSSVFLPFRKLGLVIVDEEHESSFKQYDPSPRYNARDAAMVLAHFFKAKVLLGSATPAIESYYNAKQGRYGLVNLDQRFGGLKLPEIFCADLKKERKEKSMKSHFSSFLLQHMRDALDRNEQVILFQNRRGYTPSWLCEICNWSPRCKNCDVTLTYHKHTNSLKCHYCGYSTPPVGTCNNCGSNRLKMLGFGTEKIEDELEIMFPDKKIARLDLDTTRQKNAYSQILGDFEARKIDVLIGTQMVSKGLDFDHVSLVGILDADMLLNRPDFRAFERSYQLMSQVAGRSGRKSKRGSVVIQTAQPEHWIIQKVIEHNYVDFYTHEIIERRNFFYPPFFKIIHLTLKHKDENLVNEGANVLAKSLKDVFKERVLGPEFPIVKRIQNQYLKQIQLKIEREANLVNVKLKLEELIDLFYAVPAYKSIRIVIDVDPI